MTWTVKSRIASLKSKAAKAWRRGDAHLAAHLHWQVGQLEQGRLDEKLRVVRTENVGTRPTVLVVPAG